MIYHFRFKKIRTEQDDEDNRDSNYLADAWIRDVQKIRNLKSDLIRSGKKSEKSDPKKTRSGPARPEGLKQA